MLKFIGEFFLFLSFLQSSMLMAQESDPVQIKSDTFFNTFWGDFQTATSESFSPKNYRIINLVGYGTLTALLLFNFDAELHEEYGIERENTPLGMPKFLTQIGNIYDKPSPIIFTAGLTGLMYGSGRILKNEKLIETTVLMTKSFMITAMINRALKILIGRAKALR